MKCKDYKRLIMDMIYDEISPDNKQKIEEHLQHCGECRKKYQELVTVPDFLNQWKDEPVPVQLTFTQEESSWAAILQKLIPDFGRVKKIGLGFAVILFIMALFNTKIEVTDDGFTFQTALLTSRETATPQQELTPEMLEKIQYENYKLTTQLLESYQARDEKQTVVMLRNLLTEMRKERSREYEELLGTVNHAYKANDIRIQQTSHTVDEIINLLNTGRSK